MLWHGLTDQCLACHWYQLVSESFILHSLSPRLERYKRITGKHHFRCPYCGDGKSTKSHRGAFYQYDGSWLFKCLNCGESKNLYTFISDHFPDLMTAYRIDSMNDKHVAPVKEVLPIFNTDDSWLIPASKSVIGKAYLNSRNIFNYENIFYSSEPPEQILGKSNSIKGPCIVFKLQSVKDDSFSGYQLRAISDKSKIRYSTLSVTKSYYDASGGITPRIIVEGIFDALSCGGAIAILGAQNALTSGDNIWFLDQEPHNKDIVKTMNKLIAKDEKICLLPKEFRGMDANNMLKSGMTRSDIRSLVLANMFQGMAAKLEMIRWME